MKRIGSSLVVVAFAVTSIGGVATASAHSVKPRSGSYAGQVGGSATAPIAFSFAHKTISGAIGSAPVSAKCPKQLGGFALPGGITKVKNGHFKLEASNYPYGATVGAKGKWTSRTNVSGKIYVTFTNKNKPCSQSMHFVAARTGAAPSSRRTHLAPAVKPKAGAFTTTPTSGTALTFSVAKSRTKVTKISGHATVNGPPCSSTAHSLGTGYDNAKINRAGHFKQVTGPTLYPTVPGRPTVTLKGHFTSANTAAGTVSIHFKTLKGCDATQHWKATRTK